MLSAAVWLLPTWLKRTKLSEELAARLLGKRKRRACANRDHGWAGLSLSVPQ